MTKKPPIENVRFISKFEYYEKEKSGKKRNTVRDWLGLSGAKYDRLNRWLKAGNFGTVTIQKGYTKESFTRKVTDVTVLGNGVIISW